MALENQRFLSQLPPPSPRLRGGKEGGDLRLQLEQAPLRGRSSPCSPFPPPLRAAAACPLRPTSAAWVSELRGRGGGGQDRQEGGRAFRGNSCQIFAFPRPGCFPARYRRPRRQQEGAQLGEAGAAPRGGTGRPGAKLGLGSSRTDSPSAPGTQLGAAGPEPLNPHLLGEGDTPTLVEKTFPVDFVGTAVAGSPDSDLSSACPTRPAQC